MAEVEVHRQTADSDDNDSPCSLPLDKKAPLSPPSGRSNSVFSFGEIGGCSVLVTGRLLLLAELEVLAARDDELLLGLALLALEPKGHLFGGLGLLYIYI